MEVRHIQKFIHTSPRKLRLVTQMVRKMQPTKALEMLHFAPQYAASDLSKAIKTALASAKQKGLDEKGVVFKAVEINEGPVMKRFRPGSKGRALPYKRRMSHIKIVLTDNLSSKLKMQSEKLIKEKGGKQTKVVVDNSAEKAK